MNWINVTEVLDKNVPVPETKINMDNVVRIQPMKNMGCMLHLSNGSQIRVLELANYFDNNKLNSKAWDSLARPEITSSPKTLLVEESKPKVDLDETHIAEQIKLVLINSIKGPNSEIRRRIAAIVKNVLDEKEENPSEQTATHTPTPPKKISNTTSNLGM